MDIKAPTLLVLASAKLPAGGRWAQALALLPQMAAARNGRAACGGVVVTALSPKPKITLGAEPQTSYRRYSEILKSAPR